MLNLTLDRLTYGAKPSEIEAAQKLGYSKWVAEQLHPPFGTEPEIQKRLDQTVLRIAYGKSDKDEFPALNENRPLNLLNKPVEELWTLLDGKIAYEEKLRPLRELIVSRFTHAAYSKYQIREMMVEFWLNHFNVHSGDLGIAVSMPSFERDCIRRHGLGNFYQLLESVSMSTPMLIYLNNRNSRTGAPNENFARELFELHTMGQDHYLNDLYSKWRQVPGAELGKPTGYIDQDVYEAARAFTGWVVEDGRGLGGGVNLPKTGKFKYLESWHDPYQKRILAQEFEPFGPATSDGKKVLDMLANHQATAEHLCEKICKRFVSDEPSKELIQSSAKVWMQNIKSPEQIAILLAHILESSEFMRSTEPGSKAKLKRPFELALSFVRKLELPFTPTMGLFNEISNAGQRMYYWPTPDGYPDYTGFWLTTQTMRRRWMIPMGLIENWWGTGVVSTEHITAGFTAPIEENALTKHHANKLLGEKSAASVLALLAKIEDIPAKRVLGSENNEWNLLKRNIAYLGMSPAFQWR
jgi:uncharacterized protein (DUF1800 family)